MMVSRKHDQRQIPERDDRSRFRSTDRQCGNVLPLADEILRLRPQFAHNWQEGAGNLRISPAIRCTAAAVLKPNALAAAHPSPGEPRASRARKNRTKPNRASHAAIQA